VVYEDVIEALNAVEVVKRHLFVLQPAKIIIDEVMSELLEHS
jgi:hypothetical protein